MYAAISLFSAGEDLPRPLQISAELLTKIKAAPSPAPCYTQRNIEILQERHTRTSEEERRGGECCCCYYRGDHLGPVRSKKGKEKNKKKTVLHMNNCTWRGQNMAEVILVLLWSSTIRAHHRVIMMLERTCGTQCRVTG